MAGVRAGLRLQGRRPPPPPPPPRRSLVGLGLGLGVGLGSRSGSRPGSGPSPFDDVPNEVVLLIFRKLEPEDLVHRAGAVCRRWRLIAKDERLWRDVALRSTTRHFRCTALFAPVLQLLDLSLTGNLDVNPMETGPVHVLHIVNRRIRILADGRVVQVYEEVVGGGPKGSAPPRAETVLLGDLRVVKHLDLISCYAGAKQAMAVLERFQNSLETLAVRLFDQYVSHVGLMPLIASLPRLRTLEVDGKHHRSHTYGYRYDALPGGGGGGPFPALRRMVMYHTTGSPRDVDTGVNILCDKAGSLEALTVYHRPLHYPHYSSAGRDYSLESAIKLCTNLTEIALEGVTYLHCLQYMPNLTTLTIEGPCHREQEKIKACKPLARIRKLNLVQVRDVKGTIARLFLDLCVQLEEMTVAFRAIVRTNAFHVLEQESRTRPELRWRLSLPPPRAPKLSVEYRHDTSGEGDCCECPSESPHFLPPEAQAARAQGRLPRAVLPDPEDDPHDAMDAQDAQNVQDAQDTQDADDAQGRFKRVVRGECRCPRGRCQLYSFVWVPPSHPHPHPQAPRPHAPASAQLAESEHEHLG